MEFLKDINDYYTGKALKFGNTANGVDWNSKESQELRFEQLLNLVKGSKSFSILDYGCGYGALNDYLTNFSNDIRYTGYDISKEMIERAAQSNKKSESMFTDKLDGKNFDFLVASGVFNVKLESDDDKWFEYIIATLSQFDQLCRKGFAFNILTMYSDKEYLKDYCTMQIL